jgi:hypothetical protein
VPREPWRPQQHAAHHGSCGTREWLRAGRLWVQACHRGLIGQKILKVMAAARGDQRLGGQERRLDRRPDALAAFRIGEPGRIANQQETVGDNWARAYARGEIRVPPPVELRCTRRLAADFEKRDGPCGIW